MSKKEVTQLMLLRAAERLFAERGVDAVSLREIAAAAGQRNHSATLYHFGTKRDLLEALLQRHSGPVDDSFVAALDRLRAEGRESLRDIIEVLVRPMVAILDNDGGVEYIFICAELVHSRTFPMTSLRAANGPGGQELRARLFPFLGGVPPMLLPLRMMQFASVLFGSIAAYQRLCTAGLFIAREAFIEDLVRTMVGLLSP